MASTATTWNGGGGDDRMSGGNGNDKLAGGTRNDMLTGGAGRHLCLQHRAKRTNRDIVRDFSHADDTFPSENAIFGVWGRRPPDADFLRLGNRCRRWQ